MLLPNHPNALLDPAVIWATAGRDVRFLAKSTLFDGPLRPLLAGSGAIPVYRKLDQGVDVSKNTQTFAAVDAALAAAMRSASFQRASAIRQAGSCRFERARRGWRSARRAPAPASRWSRSA